MIPSKEIHKKALAVCSIYIKDDSGEVRHANGIFIDKSTVMTAWHMVDQTKRLFVVNTKGQGTKPDPNSIGLAWREQGIAVLTLQDPIGFETCKPANISTRINHDRGWLITRFGDAHNAYPVFQSTIQPKKFLEANHLTPHDAAYDLSPSLPEAYTGAPILSENGELLTIFIRKKPGSEDTQQPTLKGLSAEFITAILGYFTGNPSASLRTPSPVNFTLIEKGSHLARENTLWAPDPLTIDAVYSHLGIQ